VNIKPAAPAYITTSNLFDSNTKLPLQLNSNDGIELNFSLPLDKDSFEITTDINTPDLSADSAWVKVWSNEDKTVTLKPSLGRLLPYGLTNKAITIDPDAETVEGGEVIATGLTISTKPTLALDSNSVSVVSPAANHTPPDVGTDLLVQPGDQIVLTFTKAVGKNSVFEERNSRDTVTVNPLKYAISGTGNNIVTIDIDAAWSTGSLFKITAVSAADASDVYRTTSIAVKPYTSVNVISIVRSTGLYTSPTAIFGIQEPVDMPLTGGSFTLTFDRIPVNATAQVVLRKQTPTGGSADGSAPSDYGSEITGNVVGDTLTISYSTPTPPLVSGETYVVYFKVFDGTNVIFDSNTDLPSTGTTLTIGDKDVLDYGVTGGSSVYLSATDYYSGTLRGIVFTAQ
jgi:hypothetical protein